jgi:dTDP-4-amino-4,6-dideoxygalactose transaminase
MKTTQEAEEIVDALKEHEQAVARLYEVYAEKFPEHEEFWTELAHEEVQHANWLVILRDRIEKNDEDFAVERLPIATIQSSIGHVMQLAERARQSDFLFTDALSTALQLEEGFIENKYFEVFDGDSADTVHTLTMLAQATQAHYERLYRTWCELRNTRPDH